MMTPKKGLGHEKMEAAGITETGRRVYKTSVADYVK